MAVSYKDYYATLGVDRKADAKTISLAFKKLAKKYHPDFNQGDKAAEEKFKEVNEAYEVLKDPKKRQMYDQLGPNWQQGQQFSDFGGFGGGQNPFGSFRFESGGAGGFSDFFQTLFGGMGRNGGGFQGSFGGADPFGGMGGGCRGGFGPQGPAPSEADIELPLENVLKGGEQEVRVSTPSGPKTLKIRVPAGVKEGVKLRLHGQGAGNGDLLLRVKYAPHPVFRVLGTDLECDLSLAPWEAALGAKVRVPTLEGEVELTLPPSCSSGKKFRAKGRGLGPQNARGDLFIRVMVKMPAQIGEEEKELWKKLAELSSFSPRG